MNIAQRQVMRARIAIGIGLVAAVAGVFSSSSAQDAGGRSWVTAWGTSQQALADTPITNATVRMIARVTVPGDNIRIRLDNTFGVEPVTIGRAFVGYRTQGALLAAGSNRPVTFNGTSQAAVPAGGSTWSDPVRLPVLAQQTPPNLLVVVFDNGLYESGGNTATLSASGADLAALASGAGIENTKIIDSLDAFSRLLKTALKAPAF